MTILAIDPGTEKIGYAIFDQNAQGSSKHYLITSGLIKTVRAKTPEMRLRDIYEKLSKVIEEHKPAQLAIEQLFFFKNAKR